MYIPQTTRYALQIVYFIPAFDVAVAVVAAPAAGSFDVAFGVVAEMHPAPQKPQEKNPKPGSGCGSVLRHYQPEQEREGASTPRQKFRPPSSPADITAPRKIITPETAVSNVKKRKNLG